MSPRALLLALAALHATASLARPQEIASRMVVASVTDTDRRPLVDIDLDDFVVREAGQLRDILSIRLADYPIAIVLDNSRDAERDFEAIRRATGRFIDRVGHRPIAIALANPPRMIATFEDDRATVIARVDKLRKSSPGNGLLQAVVTAARAVHETGAFFSAVVVVVADAGVTVPAEFMTPILESGANVHVVRQQKTPGRPNETRRQSIAALMAMVDETRGELMTIDSPDSYRTVLDRLANQLATELMVEYIVPAGSSRGSDVRVGVRVPGAKISNWGVSRR